MINQLSARLRPYAEQLKAASAAGDKAAQQVITLYRMHCDCPNDPGAYALCDVAMDDWLAKIVRN